MYKRQILKAADASSSSKLDRLLRRGEHAVNTLWAFLSGFPFYRVEVVGADLLPAASEPAVHAALHGRFCSALAAGTLPREAFGAYIAQDHFFLAAFASVLSRHARQDVVVVGVEGHPVALACEKNDAFCERVEKARAALRLASLTLEDVLEATSTMLDRTYHPIYQASIAATHEFGSQLLDLELVPTHSELGLRLCGKSNLRRVGERT